MRHQGRGPRPRCPGRWSALAAPGLRRPIHTWPGPAHPSVWRHPRPGGPAPPRRCESSGTRERARGGR
eukprot:257400-Lingulodinium_polyedra.AAC.1